jgi:hypothetical protein
LLKAIADINALEALCDLDVLDLVSVLSQPGLVKSLLSLRNWRKIYS